MLLICACPWPPAGQTAYLVTFGRAGEDNKKFKLGDVEQTLQGVPRAQTLQRTYRLVYYAIPPYLQGHPLVLYFLHGTGFAGADYDLQDALVESTDKKTTTREVEGQMFYDYELSGPVSSCQTNSKYLFRCCKGAKRGMLFKCL